MTDPLRVVSLFSGVGGFDVGLERAGMVTVAQVEWDKKCQAVLRRHWPDVPKFFDVSDVHGSDLPPCDLVAFGSPCQDLSVAGKRAGLEGNRSGLFFEAIRIIQEMLEDESRPAHARPRWVVWENVVGSLTSNKGHDFATVLDSLGELRGVEQIEWRVLDAQWFGTAERPVPQRRRRVFVVACLDPRAAGCGQVLPVGESVPGDSAACQQAGSQVAGGVAGSSGSGSRLVADDGRIVTALTKGLGSGGPDAAHAHAGWLVPAPLGSDLLAMTERERDDSRTAADSRDRDADVRSEELLQPPGSDVRVHYPDVPTRTGTVTTTWAKGPGNTQVEEGLVIPVILDNDDA